MHKLARGFTIVELMITVVVVGILASVAAPAFTSMVTSTRMSGQMNAMIGALNVARSEAQKRGQTVTVCAGTSTTCGDDWSAGYVVVLESSTKKLLAVNPAQSHGDTLSNSSSDLLQFNAAGYTFFDGTISLHNAADTPEARRCIVFSAGSWTSNKGATCP
jgi:type IV fimbrial biogenesis protein FimT